MQLPKDERDMEAIEDLRLDPLLMKLGSLGKHIDSFG
jgi:hypothetical protein